MPKQVIELKNVTYDQQGIINQLSKYNDDASQRALNLVKPEFEKNLKLYDKALKKYKK